MKKLLHNTFYSLLLLVFLLSQTGATFAISPLSEVSQLTFEELGSQEIVMLGPFGTGSVSFSLPAHWVLQEGTQIQLLLSAFFSSDDRKVEDDGYIGAMLDVYFNGELQQSLPLRSGLDVLYTIPIRTANLSFPAEDGIYEVFFALNASIDCEFPFHRTTVVVSPQSSLYLPYEESILDLDLQRLPWPIYQNDFTEQASPVLVVVPENPSEDEIRAALITTGAFGRMTRGELPMQVITAGQLTSELQSSSDLVFVGKPAGLPILGQLGLPIPVEGLNYSDTQIQQDDGLLQAVNSPWASGRFVLTVSGNSDAAVVKAAQALSTGNIQTGLRADYSIVAEVRPSSPGAITPSTPSISNPEGTTLLDIGYGMQTSLSIGTNWFSYDFVIPSGFVPTDKPSMELVYSHSAMIDPDRSGFDVYLNDELVGSAQFTEETAQIGVAKINLPAYILNMGNNRLDITAELVPRNSCSSFTFSGMWMSILPESTLHIPLRQVEGRDMPAQDLKAYPYPFIGDPSLSSTTFVLSENEASTWNAAGTIAKDLGNQSFGGILAFEVIFFDDDDLSVLENQHLIMVGTPRNLPLIYNLHEALPAYFEEGTNIAIVRDQQVVYRISEDKDLGYLEIFTSPWNDERTILAALGTTAAGVEFAGKALADFNLRSRLSGNFASVDGDQVFAMDTRLGIGTGLLISNLESTVAIEEQTVQQPVNPITTNPAEVRNEVLPILIVIAVLMGIVIFLAIWFRRRSSKNGSNSD
jgi:cellulose synthase operon protein B